MKASIDTADHFGVQLKIARAVEEVNAEQKVVIADRVIRDFGDDLTGKLFGWGVSFQTRNRYFVRHQHYTSLNDYYRRGKSSGL